MHTQCFGRLGSGNRGTKVGALVRRICSTKIADSSAGKDLLGSVNRAELSVNVAGGGSVEISAAEALVATEGRY